MASANRKDTSSHQKPSMTRRVIGLPMRVVSLLFASLLLSLVFEWIGLALVWRHQGWHHAEAMFVAEKSYLSESFKRSLLIVEPVPTMNKMIDLVVEYGFQKTGFIDFAKKAKTNAEQQGMLGFLSKVYVAIEDYLMAIPYTAMTFAVRLLILFLTIPLFVMAVVVGATDGLVRRDLRRFGAGRESSFVYHRAKALILPLAVAPWVIYLSMPISVHPLVVLLPAAFLLGLAVWVTGATLHP
jgi:integrating conjugative element membrane protein (TIGR03747 family)